MNRFDGKLHDSRYTRATQLLVKRRTLSISLNHGPAQHNFKSPSFQSFLSLFFFPSSSFTIRSLQPLLREIIGRGDGDTLSEIMIARDHPIMVYIMRLVIVSRATAADQPIGLLVNRRMIISSRASVIPINSN